MLVAFSYPDERTIVRQHDRPACFYIILTGAAMLTYNRVAHGLTETFDLLRRGCTFGVSEDDTDDHIRDEPVCSFHARRKDY